MSILLMLAAAVQGTATPPSAPVERAENARICRKLPAPTGSRVAVRRVCHTAAEWAAVDKVNDGDVDAMRRRSSRQQNY